MRLVGSSAGHAWMMLAVVIILCAAMAYYVRGHFAMTTDVHMLLSPKLPWRVRQAAFNAAFPQQNPDIVVVVDGRTPELSETAAGALAASLSNDTTLFRSVQQPQGGPFWAHNRLLFASTENVKKVVAQIVKIQPFLGSMASDPSIRGLANTLSLIAKGVNNRETSVQDLRAPLRTLADALEGLAAGHRPFFSWRTLITGNEPQERELRQIILVDPRLDFTHRQPGSCRSMRSAPRRNDCSSMLHMACAFASPARPRAVSAVQCHLRRHGHITCPCSRRDRRGLS